jgi:hypothetical protein
MHSPDLSSAPWWGSTGVWVTWRSTLKTLVVGCFLHGGRSTLRAVRLLRLPNPVAAMWEKLTIQNHNVAFSSAWAARPTKEKVGLLGAFGALWPRHTKVRRGSRSSLRLWSHTKGSLSVEEIDALLVWIKETFVSMFYAYYVKQRWCVRSGK